MKILVLSDSHSSRAFMRYAIDKVKPVHIIHLGDHFEDGKVIAEEYPHIRVHQVPGNCDQFRCDPWEADILCYAIGGVKCFMTHGHRHSVKTGLHHLLLDARKSGAEIVLYGHTHQKGCHREEDGLYVLNPGACGSWGGSVGIIEIENEKITACYVAQQADLELADSQ